MTMATPAGPFYWGLQLLAEYFTRPYDYWPLILLSLAIASW
jgi:hypothetical protein